jgi:hypothetical protein
MEYGGYVHVHVSERETAHLSPCGWDDAAWEDCRPSSTIEMLRASGHSTIPATHEEAEALRCDSGRAPTGGTNAGDMIRAAQKRYGIVIPPDTAPAAIWAALTPGKVASVGGSMAVFPDGSRWRRWDPGFSGTHQVCAFRLDATDRVWWCDPLAPNRYRSGTATLTYDGEWMSKAEFLRFATIGAAIMPIIGKEDDVDPKVDIPIGRANIAAGGSVYGDPAKSTVLIASWVGAQGVGVYSQRAGLTAIRIDLGTGGADLRIGWIGNDKVTLVTANTDAAKLEGRRFEWDRQKLAATASATATATVTSTTVTLAPKP